MSLIRPIRVFTRLPNRAAITSQARGLRTFSSSTRYTSQKSAQGYGDGQGDPKGENPQEQGPSTDAQHTAEHPGPPPPAEGRGTGGATKAGSETKDPSEASADSGGSRSKEAKETGSSPTAGTVGGSGGESTQSKDRARPKISDMKIPNEGDANKQAEVEQHNKEFEQRYDRAARAEEDKVDKKFWSGHGRRGEQS